MKVPAIAPRRGALGVAVAALVVLVLSVGAVRSKAVFPGGDGLIAFQSFANGNSEIYVMAATSTVPQRLTTPKPLVTRPCYALPTWSPDGKRMLFEYNPNAWGRPPTKSDIYVMNANGTGLRNLTAQLGPGFDGDPAWSPDGRQMIFERSPDGSAANTDVWVMNVDGAPAAHDLTPGSKGFDGDPAWSPGGRRIAFTSARTGNNEIWLVNPDGSGLLNLTNNPASDTDPTWSPDGEFVAFTSNRDGNYEIYETNDRFQLRRLTNSPSLDALPAFSPDGRYIVFESDRFQAGNRDLYLMNADGTGVRRLTTSAQWDVAPDWQRIPPGTRPAAVPKLPALKPMKQPPNGRPGTQAVACLGR